MAKDQGVVQTNLRPRSALRGAGGRPPAGQGGEVDQTPRKPFNPVQFLRETRAEARKITWTTWKETWITSVMVGIMVVVTAIFFFTVDSALSLAVSQILKFAAGGQ
ncbi:preprotein translocase subunit SecE [Caulobacter sp. KR2-114]|uniref:preprotein translocase subunit SecE n=1 Tax=Caulobacter sp. KR2-114 TaxID=3400912 RepID=UPI003C078AEA